MNKYPLWKYLLILFVLAVGFFYAAPNLFVPDPAIQISSETSGVTIDQSTLQSAAAALKQGGIDYFGEEVDDQGKSALIRLRDGEQQLRAQALVQRSVGDGFVVALNLAPTTPEWMAALGGRPMKLGLDLSGGVHFLLQVDTPAAVKKRLEFAVTGIKRKLREEKVRGFIEATGDRIVGRFKEQTLADQAIKLVQREMPELQHASETREDGVHVSWTMSPQGIKDIEDYAVEQNLTTLRNRVNELGVAEPLVQRQGRNRIVVELPGVQDTAEAKRILGKTANLEFRLEARTDADTTAKEQFEFRDSRFGPKAAWLERDIVITGENVTDAKSSFDPQNSQPEVNIVLDNEGGSMMTQATRHNVGRRLGVLFIERKSRTTRYEKDESGRDVPVRVAYDEKKIISLATIQDTLGNRFRITGLDSSAEAAELALLLRAGALAAPMEFVEERTVGPSMGAENIQQGLLAVYYGVAFLGVVMLALYRPFGLYAVIALCINVVLLIACMSILSATMTMPGIAGVVLTMAMAVDANVLINCRIKEELRNGMTPQAAIHAGYERASATILDANLTGVIIGVILYAVGTGPVRGFAVTSIIGLLISQFTAIMVTRAIVNTIYGGRRLQKLWI